MTLIGVLVLAIVAVLVIWAAMHLPPPLNWIVAAIVVVVLLVVFLNVSRANAAASWSADDPVTIFDYSTGQGSVAGGWPVSGTVVYGPGLVAPRGSARLVADGGLLKMSCRGAMVFRVGQSAPHRRLSRLLHCEGGASAVVPLLVKPSAGTRYGAGYVGSGETIWPRVAMG